MGGIKSNLKRIVAKRLSRLLAEQEQRQWQQLVSRFANRPKNLVVEAPRRIVHPECMTIGDDVYLGPSSLLVANKEYPGPVMHAPAETPVTTYSPVIEIGHRVNATGGLQVGAVERIAIGDDVLFATNVNITDAFHGYSRADIPYKYQPMEKIAPIVIGRGCWIGQNVVITPGVSIGEQSIVGANSVVTSDIPPFSIALGAPARVVKRWHSETGQWRAPT
jgi:acetyltransferase-like isoleucine patch superfamily enzyme